MRIQITRERFDDGLRSLVELPLTADQRDLIWKAIGGRLVTRQMPPRRLNQWSREALRLLHPLLTELKTCEGEARRKTIERRYTHIRVTIPGGGRGRADVQVPIISSPDADPKRPDGAYDRYILELKRIRTEMEDALREGHHWIDELSNTAPEDIAIIVENERTASTREHPRYAGTLNWTQWAKPNVMRRIIAIFEDACRQTPQKGRQWHPFTAPGRGAADNARRLRLWREAFDEAIAALDPIHADFIASLRNDHAVWLFEQAAIEHTARRPPSPIWFALPRNLRHTLANDYHAALNKAYEATGNNEYNPAYAFNPFTTKE